MRQLSALVGSAGEAQVTPPTRQLDQNDLKVMENVLKRFNKSANREDNENQ
jgi:glycerate kinase